MPKPSNGTPINAGSGLASGLVALLPFYEGSGASVNLITSGPGTPSDTPVWSTNAEGPCVVFDKDAGQRITFSLASTIAGAAWTLAVDMRCTFRAGVCPLVVGTSNATRALLHLIDRTTQYAVNLYNDDRAFAYSGSDGARQLLVAQQQADDHIQAWMNGSSLGTDTTGGWAATDTTLTVGSRPDGTEPFDGEVSMVWVWNRALSDGEIATFFSDPWQMLSAAGILRQMQHHH